LGAAAEAKQIKIETDIDPGCAAFELDPSRLRQVLHTYLSNALKFTSERGRVSITVRPEDADSVRISVRDGGVGIRQEDLPVVFTGFRELDSKSSKQYQGTGLGLALTKRMVEAQGGRVGVTTSPGTGSVFFAVLPRVARPSALTAAAARGS
ncbi:MAG: sensor histidine kinase, partial [Gaiellaceae bacterium]